MSSCKDCTKRTIGCHSFCEQYKKETEELHKKKEALRQRKNDDADVLFRLRQSGGTKWHR